MGHIRGGKIPSRWPSPLVSSLILYWRGIDFLESQWKRTERFLDSDPDIDAVHEFYFWRRNLIVWTCSTIEAFVNEEGISWLGDEFYRGNIERLDITKKIAVLYALKYHKRLSRTHAVLNEVQKLFEFRNSLIHP